MTIAEPRADTAPASSELVPAAVRGSVSIEPVEDWVVMQDLDEEFRPAVGGSHTVLLWDRQHHLTQRKRYERTAYRLDTLQAVHEAAQWRLQFNPSTQKVAIHSLSVRRAGNAAENAQPDRLRFLQREENLERLVIDGGVTVVVLLEDVRVGDILDVSFTIESQPRLLPERHWFLASVPTHAALRAFHLSVRFPAGHPLQWKSNIAEFSPTSSELEDERVWEWQMENVRPQTPEAGVPSWHFDGRWVQVSDCVSWGEVASAICAAWKEEQDCPELAGAAGEIAAAASDPEARAERALVLVQDEIRYLSDNVELGGQFPSRPAAVLRRRFGDCKDKTFLLVHLLRRLGIAARPVLVHSQLRAGIEQFLPMPDAFDHAVIEYEVAGKRRLVDATIPLQGGGALLRSVPDFRAGLPIGSDVEELARFDAPVEGDSSYELHEVFLLDTTKRSIILTVTVTTRGSEADALRRALALEGEEALAKRREQLYQQIFPEIRRVGVQEWSDDRERNEVMVAAVFDLWNACSPTGDPKFCGFQHRAHLIQSALAIPEQGKRTQPFALPYPCRLVHTIELVSPTLPHLEAQPIRVNDRTYRFTRECTQPRGRWVARYSLQTLTSMVAPEQFERHKRKLLEWWSCTHLAVALPVGVAAPWRHRPGARLLPESRKSAPPTPAYVEREEAPEIAMESKPSLPDPAPALPSLPKRTAVIESNVSDSSKELSPCASTVGESVDELERKNRIPQLRSPVPRRRRRKRGNRNARWVIAALIALVAVVLFWVWIAQRTYP